MTLIRDGKTSDLVIMSREKVLVVRILQVANYYGTSGDKDEFF